VRANPGTSLLPLARITIVQPTLSSHEQRSQLSLCAKARAESESTTSTEAGSAKQWCRRRSFQDCVSIRPERGWLQPSHQLLLITWAGRFWLHISMCLAPSSIKLMLSGVREVKNAPPKRAIPTHYDLKREAIGFISQLYRVDLCPLREDHPPCGYRK
jgi:hypothetical protein